MAQQNSNSDTDPALGTASWKRIRAYWRKNPQACWRCGREILWTARFPHPLSLAVGHIIGRVEGRLQGYSEEFLNSLQNTRPEHLECSNRSGGQLVHQLKKLRLPVVEPLEPFSDFHDRW